MNSNKKPPSKMFIAWNCIVWGFWTGEMWHSIDQGEWGYALLAFGFALVTSVLLDDDLAAMNTATENQQPTENEEP
jgi:hypothetical protein